jgi:hypothetical protein
MDILADLCDQVRDRLSHTDITRKEIIHKTSGLADTNPWKLGEIFSEFIYLVHGETKLEVIDSRPTRWAVDIELAECRLVSIKVQLDHTGGSVTVLFNQDLGDIGALGILVLLVFAVDEHDDIRVLLNRTRITKVRKARASSTLLNRTREL